MRTEEENEKRDRIELLETPRKEIVKFLKKKGWKIILVGTSGVVNNPNERGEYKYWFFMEFVGEKGV